MLHDTVQDVGLKLLLLSSGGPLRGGLVKVKTQTKHTHSEAVFIKQTFQCQENVINSSREMTRNYL